jgi:STE24 endopeptidase
VISLGLHLLTVVAGLLAVLLVEKYGALAAWPWWAWSPAPLGVLYLAVLGGRQPWSRAKRWAQVASPFAPLVGYVTLVALSDWLGVVRAATAPTFGAALPDWPGLDTGVALLPLFGLHWLACMPPHGLDARSLFTRSNVRVAQFALVWSALLGYLAISGWIAHVPALRIRLEESTLLSLVATLLALLICLVLLPRVLLVFFKLTPIEGFHRFLAEGIAERLRVKPPRLYVWNTDDELKNALVVSTFGPRPVLFTDAFLADLSIEEYQAVLAHELGHVAGRHVVLMGSLLLGATLVLEVVAASWLETVWGPVLALVFLGLMLLLAGYVSRRVELEADGYALQATGDPGALAQALVRASGGRLEQRGWRHFSVVHRLTFWRAAARDAGVMQRLRRELFRWRRLGQGLLGLGLALTLYQGLVAFPAERLIVNVREADFETANLQLADLRPLDFARAGYVDYAGAAALDELARLVAFGARLQAQGIQLDTESLGARALEVLRGVEGQHQVALLFDPVSASGAAQVDDVPAVMLIDEARALLDLALLIREPASLPLARAVANGHRFDPDVPLTGAWQSVAALLSAEAPR